jgi:hypothetical protein
MKLTYLIRAGVTHEGAKPGPATIQFVVTVNAGSESEGARLARRYFKAKYGGSEPIRSLESI